jgi:hypothetical protein
MVGHEGGDHKEPELPQAGAFSLPPTWAGVRKCRAGYGDLIGCPELRTSPFFGVTRQEIVEFDSLNTALDYLA